MRYRPFLFLIRSFLTAPFVHGQEEFFWAMAKESPPLGKEAFSLALAGDGPTGADRFRLNRENITSMANSSDHCHWKFYPIEGDLEFWKGTIPFFGAQTAKKSHKSCENY